MLKSTPARAEFKRHFGQANHYLVTSLVALSALETGDGSAVAAELRTSWNPRDKSRSIARTRDFVSKSFLGSTVDSVDLYISLLNRKPKSIHDEALIRDLDAAGRSVMQKCETIGAHYQLDDVTRALVRILIVWRNNVLHELAENRVDHVTRAILGDSARQIEDTYRHLKAVDLADKAERGADLTFKETASLIAAAHNFVEAVDDNVLKSFNQRSYCVESITDQIVRGNGARRFVTKYFSLSGEARERYVRNWLVNAHGFQSIAPDVLSACCAVRRVSES